MTESVPGATGMHEYTPDTDAFAHRVFDYVVERLRTQPPLDGPRTYEELATATGRMITEHGLGVDAALAMFRDVLAPACISSDHPRYVAFVPTAPTESARLFDMVVSASAIYGDWWLEGAGAIYAEMETLAWLARCAGFPEGANGVFLSGGTAGNLTALTVARETWRHQLHTDERAGVAAAPSAHSSIRLAAKVIDAPVVPVEPDELGRLTADRLRVALDAAERPVFAVVATAGATNTGVIDDLRGVAEVCAERGLWMHVDAAYGGAGLLSSTARPRFAGIERADSFVVDPHKWLFAPFDCAALLYRDPDLARAALAQHAGYLETLAPTASLNPSDLGVHMTRRVRGLPLWFSLTAHGSAAYDRAITHGIELAAVTARRIEQCDHLELVMEPELSVVLFRRRGWTPEQYQAWSDEALDSGLGLLVPTVFRGETMFRFCFVNPLTTPDDVDAFLDALR